MKSLICIACPKGCHLSVDDSAEEITVTGNECPRGKIYGIKEVTNPTRVITSTVKVVDSISRRLPVVTNGSIPKGLMFDAMAIINSIVVKPPIKMKEVLVENLLDTGIDLISSKTILK